MATFCEIPTAVIFDVSGRDTNRYLNARLSNDIRPLEPGNGVYAAALTAQGKPQALFRVYCKAPGAFRLVCDGGVKEEVQSAFMQFVVADDVQLADQPAMTLLHLWGENADQIAQTALSCDQLPEEPLRFLELDDLGIARCKRTEQEGFDLFVPGDQLQRISEVLLATGCIEQTPSDLRTAQHRAGIARFPEQINERFGFLESGHKSAVSHTKGCYVGQEVVEKTEALGKLPARLMYGALSDCIELEPGTNVLDEISEKPIGSVVSSAQDGQRTYVFVRIRQTEIAENHSIVARINDASLSLTPCNG